MNGFPSGLREENKLLREQKIGGFYWLNRGGVGRRILQIRGAQLWGVGVATGDCWGL